MKTMRVLQRIRRLIRGNWRALAVFELFYKIAAAAVLVPLTGGCLSLLMKATGFGYVTLENVRTILLHPLTIALALLLLFLAVACGAVDIGAVIYILDQSRQGRRAKISHALAFAAKNARRALKARHILIAGVLVLLAPILHLGLAVGALVTISIPDFIVLYIHKNALPIAGYAAAALLLSLFVSRWLYAFHYFALAGRGFREACRESAALGRGQRIQDFGIVLIVQALFAVFYLLIFLIMVVIAVAVSRVFREVFLLQWVTSTVVWGVVVLAILVSFALATPVSYGCVSELFYAHLAEKGREETFTHAPDESPVQAKKTKRIYAALGCLIAAAGLTLGYFVTTGRLNPQIEYLRTTEITAHRGASAQYPENTMAAFRGAQELGADWIELDVQQTRDGEIVVMHDTNTRRTTGVRGYIWDMTLEEVRKLDAGSWFGPEFAGEPIPLLREVAEFAAESGMRLNIELKPTGHEVDFERCVIDIIREYDIAENCVITSQAYRVLENVKKIDEDITTGYVTSLAFGDITRLTAADHFSVEVTSATRGLISRVHNAGKLIYAWTVNNENRMEKLIERNVDNLITDNILMARQCVDESRYSDLLSEFVKLLQ